MLGKVLGILNCFWALMGSQGLKMCDSRSLGMGDIDICRGMGIGMNLGSHNMIFTIQNYAWKNVTKLGYFGLFLGSDRGPRSPRCVIKAPLG